MLEIHLLKPLSLITQDTLNPDLCKHDCEMLFWVSPIYFAIFVLSTQFVLVNVVVAVLMKQLEDSKDSIASSSDDSLSDMNESFSNERKSSHSEYEASGNYAAEAKDIRLDVGTDRDRNRNTEIASFYKDSHPGCEIRITDDCELRQSKDEYQISSWRETGENGSSPGECGLENAIIVVSPARGCSYENSYLPYMSNEEDEYYEMKADTCLGLASNSGHPEISLCRSMPELSRSMTADNRVLLHKTRESQSCPQTMSCSREETTKSKCKKAALDRALLVRKRSRGKVAPLSSGLTVPSQTLSVHEDTLSTSVSYSNIES